ncbi:hypothetical protein LguiB_019313 [Lonicera macranthoides]
MAMAMVRSGLRNVLRGGTTSPAASRRTFAFSAHHDDAYEMAKWEKITYAGIVTCTILAIINLSKGHPHYEEPPPYPYLHIRNKEFPWGMFANHGVLIIVMSRELLQPYWSRWVIGEEEALINEAFSLTSLIRHQSFSPFFAFFLSSDLEALGLSLRVVINDDTEVNFYKGEETISQEKA